MLCLAAGGILQGQPRALSSNTATSDSLAPEYFCAHRPRRGHLRHLVEREQHHLVLGADGGKRYHPRTVAIAQASFGMQDVEHLCFPLRVLPTQSSSLTTNPPPSPPAIRNLRSPLWTNSESDRGVLFALCR